MGDPKQDRRGIYGMAYTEHLSEEEKEEMREFIRDYERILRGDLTETEREIEDKKKNKERI